MWDYSTVTERRSLYENKEAAETWLTVTGLIPHSSYYVQVNASNSQGYVLSNTLTANMPMGCEYCGNFLVQYWYELLFSTLQ